MVNKLTSGISGFVAGSLLGLGAVLVEGHLDEWVIMWGAPLLLVCVWVMHERLLGSEYRVVVQQRYSMGCREPQALPKRAMDVMNERRQTVTALGIFCLCLLLGASLGIVGGKLVMKGVLLNVKVGLLQSEDCSGRGEKVDGRQVDLHFRGTGVVSETRSPQQ